MSNILTGVNSQRPMWANDDSLQSLSLYKTPSGSTAPVAWLWSRSGILGCDIANLAWIWDSREDMWGPYDTISNGSRSGYFISGQTLNSNGGVMANCTVDLFDSATDLFVATVTSDAQGYYRIATPYNATVYAVGHEEVTPTMGATDIVTPT